MKTKKIYLLIGIITIAITLFFTYRFKRPCEQLEKPENIPVSAIWKGGCDGGVWIELVEIKMDTIRARIYNDWNGDLLLDAVFISENCKDVLLTKTNLNENIIYFDGEKIYTKIQVGRNYCRFTPVFPAYYKDK